MKETRHQRRFSVRLKDSSRLITFQQNNRISLTAYNFKRNVLWLINILKTKIDDRGKDRNLFTVSASKL